MWDMWVGLFQVKETVRSRQGDQQGARYGLPGVASPSVHALLTGQAKQLRGAELGKHGPSRHVDHGVDWEERRKKGQLKRLSLWGRVA